MLIQIFPGHNNIECLRQILWKLLHFISVTFSFGVEQIIFGKIAIFILLHKVELISLYGFKNSQAHKSVSFNIDDF